MSGIIFLKDWEKYPNAIIDTKTKNTSFIELAVKLKMQGIKNHAFMLALHNPRLLGVDPFDPNLTQEQMLMISVECNQNFWYSVRNIWMAPAIAGVGGSLISLNRGNLSLWWSFLNHITYILTQPRQTGKSFCTDVLMSTLMNFLCYNSQFNLLTKDDTLRVANIERLKKIYDELPPYLKYKTRADSNNTTDLTIRMRGNTYYTHVPQTSEKGAYKLGRGLTSPVIQVDEPPFQPHIAVAMGSALGAMGAACDVAKQRGEPYGVILTTTAGKQDDSSGKYVYNLASGSAIWSDLFYDAAGPEELEQMVRQNSPDRVYRVYGCFSHTQLGKDDAWLLEQLERTTQSADDANRDYFNIWTRGGISSPLTQEQLKAINASKNTDFVSKIQSTGSYILRWHLKQSEIEDYMRNSRCVVGIDTSDASGRDDIGVTLTDTRTGAVVAVGNFNETNLVTFAQFCVRLLIEIPGSVINFERRSSAIAIIDYLLMFLPAQGIDPFARLFNWVVNDPLEHEQLAAEVARPMWQRSESIYVRAKRLFGFATSGSGRTSRDALYSTTLGSALSRFGSLVKDPVLIDQINGLVIRNGRIDHDEGKKDDVLISYLLGHWFLTQGKNLNRYGIDPKEILVKDHDLKAMSPVAFQKHMEQSRIRSEIVSSVKELEDAVDEFLKSRIVTRLRSLEKRLVLEEGESFSLDAILTKMREEKGRQKRYAYSS